MYKGHGLKKKVILKRVGDELDEGISDALCSFLPQKIEGMILVKPNRLKPKDQLFVTSVPVIIGDCKALSRCGVRLVVGDSPAFGNARRVIRGMRCLFDSSLTVAFQVTGFIGQFCSKER